MVVFNTAVFYGSSTARELRSANMPGLRYDPAARLVLIPNTKRETDGKDVEIFAAVPLENVAVMWIRRELLDGKR